MDREQRLFRSMLKKNRLFITKPRIRLFKTLQNHPTLTLNELIGRLPQHDQTTVYRNIKIFERLGIINRLQLGWKSRLELSDIFQHHHHHLTCLNCGTVTVLKENRAVEQQIANMTRQQNFKPLDHQLEIRGLCKNCQTVS